ncbi:metal-dependent transcriptional regulator [Desulfobulbus alkaliphilus]|uniref:metal-dependent transcriptional regulator n=1 Tax=Desulfobulbus alkaliphilus TaxID=869814 RepID=UPI0019655952|nr:metal-dependent transcriptional regulator [Desulfobulbus alkaliphilus]MBM9538711.1 metal-dependent transcriptional regulator [Desulfobulbus alkaliphilus]
MPRRKKLSASMEDYLEAIYLISREQGHARNKEIIHRLGVSGPSVTEALQTLSDRGLVNYVPYESVTLTPQGEAIAADVYHRHQTLRDFFVEVLCLDEQLADEGACKIEHVISMEFIERIVRYTRYIKKLEGERDQGANHCSFEEYLEKKKTSAPPSGC